MYLLAVTAFMLVFPLVSIGLQSLLSAHGAPDAFVVARWFVFWAVGVRLLFAGIRQIVQPRFTAEQVLGIKAPDARLLVRELGFANVAIGCAAAASLHFPAWVLPLGFVGTIFYGLAGINHCREAHRNRLQTIAMVSDLFAAVVLLASCMALILV